MTKLVLEPEFTSIDIKEYVELTMDLISKEMDKSKGKMFNNFNKNGKSFFLNVECEEFFMYLLKENENKKNKSFFSIVYRYLFKENFFNKDFEKPRHFFSFLKEKEIFEFKPEKIISSSVSSEETSFIEFDQLYMKFLLLQE